MYTITIGWMSEDGSSVRDALFEVHREALRNPDVRYIVTGQNSGGGWPEIRLESADRDALIAAIHSYDPPSPNGEDLTEYITIT
jgi:hypothetical protein